VSLGKICRKGSVDGWVTSTGPNGKVLVIPTDRLKSLSRGPSLGVQVKLKTFNWSQSRAVTGLLPGHNTLRRHLHLLGLHDRPLCRKCGAKEETSAHILCEYEALASLRQAHLGSFFLEPEDIRRIGLGAIWTYNRSTGLP
jgi:hypothetical protein